MEDTWVEGGYQPPPKPYKENVPLTGLPRILRIIGESDEADQVKSTLKYLTQFNPGTKEKWIRPIDEREVSMKPLLPFEPYEDTDILTKSQSYKGDWE